MSEQAFLDIEIEPGEDGRPTAYGYCVACDAERSLDVAPFTGVFALSCPVCRANQVTTRDRT